MLNLGFSVLVMIAAISSTRENDAFSPVSRYLSPSRPLSIAAIWPPTTSSTWQKESLSFPRPIYPGKRPVNRSINWNGKSKNHHNLLVHFKETYTNLQDYFSLWEESSKLAYVIWCQNLFLTKSTMGMNIFIGGGGKQLQMNVITSNKNMMHHVILRTVIEVVSDVHKQIPCLKKICKGVDYVQKGRSKTWKQCD